MRMNTMVPMQKSIRFFIRMLPAFFALVKPVSTIANPACIQKTGAAPIRNQMPVDILADIIHDFSRHKQPLPIVIGTGAPGARFS